MRHLAIVFSVLALAPLSAFAQAVPTAAALDGGTPALMAAPEPAPAPVVTPEPVVVVAAEPSPVANERELGLYVGVGLGSSLNLGGGSFGYQLEAAVGMYYWIFSAEILGGTTSINSDQLASVGPHIGGALRVHVLDTEHVGLQLGLGARHHSARADTGVDYRFTGGFASMRLMLPVTENIHVRIDGELEHAFDGPLSGAARNRLMLGFGIETRIAP